MVYNLTNIKYVFILNNSFGFEKYLLIVLAVVHLINGLLALNCFALGEMFDLLVLQK